MHILRSMMFHSTFFSGKAWVAVSSESRLGSVLHCFVIEIVVGWPVFSSIWANKLGITVVCFCHLG